jgi:SAM-dependent methyltransferase
MKNDPSVIGKPQLPGKLSALGWELLRKIRQVGIFGTAAHVGSKLVTTLRGLVRPPNGEQEVFDAKYGTDTEGIIGVGALDIPPDQMEHSMHYGPIGVGEFMRTLGELDLDFERLVFVDVGSGKGRMLLLASLFPFSRIMGVELSRFLHDVAVKNIEIFKDAGQRCFELEAVNDNGATFQIPEESTLFFLANPFDHHVMRLFLSNLKRSLIANPRQIRILYIKPVYRETLDQSEFLGVVRDTGRYVFYKNTDYWQRQA